MSYSTENIRNIALAGHAGAGKTTLFEALLHAGGVIQTQGSVERGTTQSDTDAQEKARGHSIDSCIAGIDRGGCHINLIDTAGYPDFRGGTLSAFAAVETVAVVVNAANGVEHGTRRMMEHARERGLARLLVVNKIDAEGADLPALAEALREEFGPECLPVNLPADGGRRVLDCFFHAEGATDLSSLAEAHQRILDQVVEVSEKLMDRYLDAGEGALTREQLHDAFEQCLREGHLVPVCFVSARTGAGVAELLELAERLLPNPAEGNPPPFLDAGGAPIAVSADPGRHVVADVFKIVNDPFVGKLSVFRVWQGTIRRDSQLYVDDGRKPFKVGHLFRLNARNHVEIERAIPGDIAAVAKVEEIHFDAVLHDSHEEDRIRLAPPHFPQPMFGLALEPKHKGQEQKLSQALLRLAEEDPCLRVEHHKELNETVVRGLSELHLKVMLERMRERYGVEVVTHPPRIAYRETIAARADGHHRHKKQTGGAGQFGEVFLRVEPLERGGGFEFVDEVKGGVIPNQFLPAIEKGVRQAMERGAVAGYPMQDLRVTVYDGKYHPVDSKEVAFVSAGKKAFLDAVGKARPIVLEPIVDVEVAIPEANVGDVTGGLAGKRARILGTDARRGGELVIRAQAPLAELTDYPTELKAMTGGRGRYSLDLSHYEPVPPPVQKQLSEAWKPHVEED
ncbi:elongation factor G [Fulvimonas soli]|uniref:Elongation factor G n=1 Tax=Fulvimonas soli TaxID=155197 RepID=A0A316IAJ9_9GAMM|nr:elongation factor G [Fulvimonas soli]PWK84329.1 translation elongation factor 2 (EF-2/EF-G) [Fulvimonas soli]TNY25654.1 elongation factor G [Fulvimonas soli]